MNFKKIALSASAILLATMLTNGYMVQADDDNEYHDEHEYHKKYEKSWDDDDDRYEHEDEYEYDEGDNPLYPTVLAQDTWNNWTRTTSIEKGNLPFNEPTNVTLKLENENNELSFTIIPRDGELFVPGKAVADALGATATVYETSQILEVTTENAEIILKANTNVAYENNVKTPLPSTAFSMNDDIYMPISVITNGLGYSVEWQEENNLFICRTSPIY